MLTLTLTAAVLLALIGFTAQQRPAWQERDITSLLPWPALYTLQLAFGLTAAAYIGRTWGTPAGVSAAAFAWLTVLAVSTDLKTLKVPWNAPHAAALVGLICWAFDYTTEGAFSFAASLVGLVALPAVARALTNKGLGLSDVRLLWAATASVSWWSGQTWLLYALILACGLQLLVRIAASIFGFGRLVPAREAPATVTPDETQTEPHTAATSPRATATAAHPTTQTPTKVRLRRELPFAPALLLAICLTSTYGTYIELGACQTWRVIGGC